MKSSRQAALKLASDVVSKLEVVLQALCLLALSDERYQHRSHSLCAVY